MPLDPCLERKGDTAMSWRRPPGKYGGRRHRRASTLVGAIFALTVGGFHEGGSGRRRHLPERLPGVPQQAERPVRRRSPSAPALLPVGPSCFPGPFGFLWALLVSGTLGRTRACVPPVK